MKNHIRTFLIAFAMMIGVGSLVVAPAGAINVFDGDGQACKGNNAKTAVCKGAKNDSLTTLIRTVVSILLFVTGTLSVVMIIIGGIKYVVSNGNAAQVTSAKNTVLYAVIGLVVSLLAYVIVGFVLSQF